MSKYIDKQLQEEILHEFNERFGIDGDSATRIRRNIADEYEVAYSTVHKITNQGYKLKEAKLEKPAKVKKFKSAEKKPKYKVTSGSTLIFTSWEIRIGVNKDFIDILNQLKNYYNATIFLTVLWPEDVKFLPPELEQFNLLMSDLKINNNIIFKYVPTHVLSSSPLAGWSGAHDTSVIFPGAVKELQSEKTHKLCKQLITTGSIGRLNAFLTQYNHIQDEDQRTSFMRRWSLSQNRRGGKQYEIAKQFTVPSALIVDVKDSNTFFTRYVTMEKNGVVYDKNLKFTSGQEKPEASRPKAFVVGDMHSFHADKENFKALTEMWVEFKPEIIVLNDFFDGASINHHQMNDYAEILKMPTLEEEVLEAKDRLNILIAYAEKIYYLQSNHDNFIIKYLSNENNYKLGPNYKEAIELRAWQLQNPDRHPVEKLLNLDSKKNLEFIPESEILTIAGNVVAHGHVGISGKRVGFLPMAKVFNRYVGAHLHYPQIFRNAGQVGTSSKLDLDYNLGPNSWLHAHCLIQPDGSLQILPVIYGKYCL